jgi:transcriptional regulator with XRE-family HTH domain
MQMYQITIADKIKAYRNENNLSLKEFGKIIGISAQAIYKWEHNCCYPDIIILPYLAQILECTIDDFFKKYEEDKNYIDVNT